MTTAAEFVEKGKAAQNAGMRKEALEFYRNATELYRGDGELGEWAHSLRHYAAIALQLGDGMLALESIAEVFQFYEKNSTSTLELANTYRIGALAHEAVGEPWKAEREWLEALALYTTDGVQAGVDEALAHLKTLGVG